jgi:hypothetical protein
MFQNLKISFYDLKLKLRKVPNVNKFKNYEENINLKSFQV